MPLKIAIVTEYCYPLIGGITENVHNTAARLTALGHTVTIVTSRVHTNGVRAPEIPPDAAGIVRIGRSMPIYSNGSIGHVTIGMHLWRDLRNLFARERFDIAQLHGPLVFTLPAMAVIAAKVARCPRIGTLHTYFDGSAVYDRFRGILHPPPTTKTTQRTVLPTPLVQSRV